MFYISDTFSLQMLDLSIDNTVDIKGVPREEVVHVEDLKSAIDSDSTAKLISSLMDRTIEANPEPVKLTVGDTLFVAQISRESATGAVSLRFLRVKLL